MSSLVIPLAPEALKAFTFCGTKGISGVVSSLEIVTVMRSDCPTIMGKRTVDIPN